MTEYNAEIGHKSQRAKGNEIFLKNYGMFTFRA